MPDGDLPLGFAIMTESKNLVDREGYNDLYSDAPAHSFTGDPDAYVAWFERTHMRPFFQGGPTKGYVRGLAIRKMFTDLGEKPLEGMTVLDAGCGAGELSVYLACRGLNVVSVDVSEIAIAHTLSLAQSVGVGEKINGVPASLEDIPIEDHSIDGVIGIASLHHFIKYPGVPSELNRVLAPGGSCYFADSFGENRIYHVFHDKEKMCRLGDVILTRSLILQYFDGFDVSLTPTDWLVMIDKVLTKLLPKRAHGVARLISRAGFHLDRLVPSGSRIALFLSGAVFTQAQTRTAPRH